MLYPTLNQPLMIVTIAIIGVVGGLLFDLVRILSLVCFKSKTMKCILEFMATVCCALLLFVANLKFNYGQFRVYVLAIFILSFALEKIFVKFLWTKLLKKWYSSITQRRKEVGQREEGQDN